MIDFNYAQQEFEKYLDDYDRKDEKINLKIIHTYGVVKDATAIATRMQLAEEDLELAKLIALLHDIGRFEQIKIYNSFENSVMDHAAFGVETLFGSQMMIRRFIKEDTWDAIIKEAIAHHSDFHLPSIADARTLLHARLIRDADKLDNCRVKLEDDIPVFMDETAEQIGSEAITDSIWEACLREEEVLSSMRNTKMDYWVSYIAYFYDINFSASFAIIDEKDYVARIIDRIPYSNPVTASRMAQLKEQVQCFVRSRI